MKACRLFISVYLFGCILFGCSKDARFETVIKQPEQIGLTKSADSSVENKEKVKPFTQNMLAPLAKAMGFKGDYELDSVNKSNAMPGEMPVMYVMNFEEGGWMIVAGHIREENQILAYSKHGNFNIGEIDNPNVKFWFEMTRNRMEGYEIESPSASDMLLASPHLIDPDQEYLWIRIPLDAGFTPLSTFSTGHLLSTKWGQGEPWNSRTPHPYANTYCYTGCVAVSIAQILYYLKMSAGFSIGLSDVSGDFNIYYEYPSLMYYQIENIRRNNYNVQSGKWANMKLTSAAPGNAEYVAELMFDIAEHAGMKFFSDGSGTSVVSTSFFSPYGVSCDSNAYDFNIVKASLDASLPVEIHCHADNSRHSWVIDGYETNVMQSYSSFQWLRVPAEETSSYHFDDVMSDRYMERLHPEVENGDVIYEYRTLNINHLLMNWGYDGNHDDDSYAITPEWQLVDENVLYNSHPMIIYNFRQ